MYESAVEPLPGSAKEHAVPSLCQQPFLSTFHFARSNRKWPFVAGKIAFL